MTESLSKTIKEELVEDFSAVTGKARATARSADAFVHKNPWQTLGAGAGIGVALGVLLGALFYRR